ncbi:MAG: hypothetical protein A2176_05805 [Spirochaetes bacterium RBG_13_51_14]|nr:MAG: hypothetical protein A2176_05805 [Spirochaetes bacterium RBG_13_51_14]
MKKTIIFLLILLIPAGACRTRPDAIPTGTWKYRLLVNGADIGSAVVTNAVTGKLYVSTLEMQMDAGVIKNTSRQIITETLDFKPVKLEVYNTTTQNGQVSEMKTIAQFNGARVDLDTGDLKTSITIEKPFILEGNYFMNELIKSKFKDGTIIKHYIYEPSVDIEEPVLVLVKVMGREEVEVNGKTKNLIHLGLSIDNLKNIDSYIDGSGITQKTVITMLNNRLELILE